MRWNSLYYMIARYVDMSKITTQLLLDATDSPELLTGQEIEILKQLMGQYLIIGQNRSP